MGITGRPSPGPRSSSVPPSMTKRMLSLDSFDTPIMRQQAPASRTEALMLSEAFDKMEANIRLQVGGRDPSEVAKEAALGGESDKMMNVLEPQLYLLDIVMGELCKQVRMGCSERGSLLERCRSKFVDVFTATSVGLDNMARFVEEQKKINVGLEGRIAPLQDDRTAAMSKVGELEGEVETLKERIEQLEQQLAEAEIKSSMSQKEEILKPKPKEKVEIVEVSSEKEEQLLEQIREADAINGVLLSKANILEGQNKQMKAKMEVMQLQVSELEDRVRRDAATLDSMGELAARYKVRVAWLRAIAFVRRQKKETREVETQDGAGVDANAHEVQHLNHQFANILGKVGGGGAGGGGGGGVGLKSDEDDDKKEKGNKLVKNKTRGIFDRGGASKEEQKHRVLQKEEILGHVISYAAFWGSIIKQAEEVDFVENPLLQMSKKTLHEFIAKIYQEKILADEHDDAIGIPRQSLPEFLYDYHLEMLAEPQLAEQALVHVIANVRVYDRISNRVRMFSRFLNLGGQPFPLEALNIYLVSLVRIQSGQIPILPDNDSVMCEAARALRVIEYVFGQAPFVIRSKILQEAEKRVQGKNLEVDSLLLFIVEQWRDESSRAEERLRALFVASDSDGDGNLDYDEFTEMIQHVNTNKGQRECLRMYAEMTLNRVVDCNTFVRSARKFRFFTFEVGPAVRKSDKFAQEMFEVIQQEWKKVEDLVLELTVVLEGTRVGGRLLQRVHMLKKLFKEGIESELAWLCYRSIVSEFTSAIRNRLAKAGDAK